MKIEMLMGNIRSLVWNRSGESDEMTLAVSGLERKGRYTEDTTAYMIAAKVTQANW